MIGARHSPRTLGREMLALVVLNRFVRLAR
jgi:hypothetical protein